MALFVTARHTNTFPDGDRPPAGLVYEFACLLTGSAGELPPQNPHVCYVSVLGDDSPAALRSKIASGIRANFAAEGYTIPTGAITFNDYVKG